MAVAPKPITYEVSASGFYDVNLSESFERRKFVYKPGLDITVNREILDEMIEAKVVASVNASN